MTETKTKTVVLPRKRLDHVIAWLSGPLHGQEARARARFVAPLVAELESMERHRLEIIKRFASLDESGAPKVVEVDLGGGAKSSEFAFPTPEAKAEAGKEIADERGTDFAFNVPKDDFLVCRKLLLNGMNGTLKFTLDETAAYEEVCALIERN